MSVLLYRAEKKTGPASGIRAELLAEISQGASALLKLVELERSGGFGQGFWVGSDSVLETPRRLVALAEQRAAELRDAGPRR
jgi:hypothetical protein